MAQEQAQQDHEPDDDEQQERARKLLARETHRRLSLTDGPVQVQWGAQGRARRTRQPARVAVWSGDTSRATRRNRWPRRARQKLCYAAQATRAHARTKDSRARRRA